MSGVGFVCGKFMPLHQGHELLLQVAASLCDEVHVLIGTKEGDPYSFQMRRDWVEQILFREGVVSRIQEQPEHDRDRHPKDQDGTITDERWWDDWVADTTRLLEPVHDIRYVFSSDLYGAKIAERLGAEWIPVDPGREIIDVRATDVRLDFTGNFMYLPQHVRESLSKTVAIVGPESTGKSTLTRQLAELTGGVWTAEWGRTLCNFRSLEELTTKDYIQIGTVQNALIRNMRSRVGAYPLLVTDTEALVTALWHEYRLGSPCPALLELFRRQEVDLYLLMAPTVPIVDDGTRVMTQADRRAFFNRCSEHLEDSGKNFRIILSSDYHERGAAALDAIRELMT